MSQSLLSHCIRKVLPVRVRVPESGANLLNTPDLSVPFKMNSFEVEGVGGGLVIANHYGATVILVARVDIGVLGKDWNDID